MKPLHFIGLGDTGCKVLEYFQSKKIEGKYSYINNLEDKTYTHFDHAIHLKPSPLIKLIQGNEIPKSPDIYDWFEIPSTVMSLFNEDEKFILVAGLGGFTGTYLLKELTKYLKSKNKDFISMASIPFTFEGAEKKQYALDVVRELNTIPEFHHFDLNQFVKSHSNISVSEAFEMGDREFYELFQTIFPPFV